MASLTVTTTPTLIPANSAEIRSLTTNSATIYIGGSTVSSSTGVELLPGEPFAAVRGRRGVDLYAVTATGTADLRYLNYPA